MNYIFLKPGEETKAKKGLVIYRSNYSFGNDIALEIEDIEEGPFCVLTENLIGYGILPEKDQIIISHDMYTPFFKDFIDSFCDFLVEKRIKEVVFGPYNAKGLLVQLKPNWKDLTFSYE